MVGSLNRVHVRWTSQSVTVDLTRIMASPIVRPFLLHRPGLLLRTPDPYDAGKFRMLVHANLHRSIGERDFRAFCQFQRYHQRDGLDFVSVFQSNSKSSASSIRHDVAIYKITVFRFFAPHFTRESGCPTPSSPCRNLSTKFVKRRIDLMVRTAIANAFGCPMMTTNCLPRVTPVYSRFRSNMG